MLILFICNILRALADKDFGFFSTFSRSTTYNYAVTDQPNVDSSIKKALSEDRALISRNS